MRLGIDVLPSFERAHKGTQLRTEKCGREHQEPSVCAAGEPVVAHREVALHRPHGLSVP